MMLQIGFSEVDITPQPGLRTAGMPMPPQTEGVLYPLFGRIMVFDDGVQSAAIVTLDNLGLETSLIPVLRKNLSAGTSLTAANIMITCTHTHSAPTTAAVLKDGEIDYEYVDFLRSRLVEGIRSALRRLKPARLKAGSQDAPGWTFNRRQIYRSAVYGEQVGTQGPQTIPDFLRNEGPEDNQLQALLAETPDGKALGGLVNFACHPSLTYGSGKEYSADYPGPLTGLLSERHGCPFGFLQGASGNLWGINTSLRESEREAEAAHVHNMITDLADKAGQALEHGAYLKDGPVRMLKKVLHIPQRRPSLEQLELARWYLEKAPENVDQQAFTRQIYQHDYTFYDNTPIIQEWFARETISLWEWQRRAGSRELVERVEIQAIAVGDLAFVGFPVEYFTEFGLRIKAKSPFRFTWVVQLANGWQGYVPTREAFAHGGYEPRLAYTSRLAPGAGDLMCKAALDLLNKSI